MSVAANLLDPLVKKLERYTPVSDTEKGCLVDAVDRVDDYKPGAAIVVEGSSPSTSCLVLSGFVSRVRILPAGGRQILAFHIASDFCDLHSFVLPKMDHGIQALTSCQIAKVPHRKLAEIVEQQPRLARALWWDTAVDAAIHREWMIGLGRRSSFERAAHLYCEMLLRLQAIGATTGNSYDLPATQEDLGDAFGLTPVHVNRVLKKMRESRLITVHRNQVTIPNFKALKKAAKFDATYLAGRIAPDAEQRVLSFVERKESV